MANWSGDTGWTSGADGPPVPAAAGGFVELCGQDFQAMTPTVMASVATHTVDGEDLTVGSFGGGTSWEIDSTGLFAVGGTGFAWIQINFAQFGITATDYEMLAVVIDIDDTAEQWGVRLHEDFSNYVGVNRYLNNRLKTMVMVGGVYNDDIGGIIGYGTNQHHAIIWCAGAAVSRSGVTPTGGPLSLSARGPSAHNGNEGGTFAPVGAVLSQNTGFGRSAEFRSWKLYGVPTA